MILEEMINDPEVYFSALEERGRSGDEERPTSHFEKTALPNYRLEG
jgi:hypothetical protein